jgi:hypothetical protein
MSAASQGERMEPTTGAKKPNPRGAGSTDHAALRERLRRKGQARAGSNPRAEETGKGGGGP